MKYSTTDFFNALYGHNKMKAQGLNYIVTFKEIKEKEKENDNRKEITYNLKNTTKNINGFEKFDYDKETGFKAINRYFTPNSFSTKSTDRTASNVIVLNCMYIDIDFKKSNKTLEQALEQVNNLNKKPNIIVKTGNGLQIYYLMESIPVFERTEKENRIIKLYKMTMQNIAKELQNVGGDLATTSISNLMRFPNSENVKAKKGNYGGVNSVEIHDINTEHIYTLKELATEFSNYKNFERKEIKIKSLDKKRKRNNIKFDLANDRVDDLIKLIDLRKGQVEARNDFLRLCVFFNKTRVYELNSHFLNQEEQTKVDSLIEYHERTTKEDNTLVYKTRWTNQQIINVLKVTDLEQKELKTIISKEESYNRLKERRELPKLLRKTNKDLKKFFIQNCYQELTNKELQDILGVSKRTIQNYRKDLVNIFELNSNINIILNKLNMSNYVKFNILELTETQVINLIQNFDFENTFETKKVA